MNIKFHKYQGAGNDFIIIDNRKLLYDFPEARVKQFCDRRFGIGADGLMLLENCQGYDFRMRYFNADGREASLCGNGSRCILAYARQLGLFSRTARFMAADGEHTGEITPTGVRIRMQDIKEIITHRDYYFLNTGSPHYVKIVEDAYQTDVYRKGKAICNSAPFQPQGTNVNFITPTKDYIKIATYERGVENETLACGTGCVASALCISLRNQDNQNTYLLKAKGGTLKVSFERKPDGTFTNIWLEGPAEKVFEGKLEWEAGVYSLYFKDERMKDEGLEIRDNSENFM